ncbi:ATP-binding protein [Tuberibacillus calidus]|jgi:MoxR-like ATPase|uniref:ATP-binding protein n=1 Tax=Tuberibacillus calidus TaxID=340097 RepID=UPI0003F9D9F3|nr:MoxR family ATPase [Tuberibacillus calidus]
MHALLSHYHLTETIAEQVEATARFNKNKRLPEEVALIGKPGYTAPDEAIIADAVTALALGKNVLLKGPTGSGKTRLAELLSSLFYQPMQMINCSVDLDAEALLGYKTLTYDESGKSHITFVPGPVTTAMQKGHFLYIDEINMAKAETLPILNGVLDYRRTIHNPFTAERIEAAAGFNVIAAINEGYVGTTPLNEALKNRFVVIEVPYLQGAALKQLLTEQTKLTDERLLAQFVSLSRDLIFKVQDGQIAEEGASIRSLIDACDLSTFLPPMRAVRRAIADKLEDERERVAVLTIAETYFGKM